MLRADSLVDASGPDNLERERQAKAFRAAPLRTQQMSLGYGALSG